MLPVCRVGAEHLANSNYHLRRRDQMGIPNAGPLRESHVKSSIVISLGRFGTHMFAKVSFILQRAKRKTKGRKCKNR